MLGAWLVRKIRRIIKDDQDFWTKGVFWSDRELYLCLNMAQYNFVNYCLFTDTTYYLNALVTSTIHESISNIPVTTIPDDYMHYISGQVGDDVNKLKTAKIYLGGEGILYRYSNYNSAIIIIGNDLMFIDNGIIGKGILHYYRYPTEIIAGNFQDDFDTYVYTDILVNNAAVIAGMKEIQTQREFKKKNRLMLELKTNPIKLANYVGNNDLSSVILKGMANEK